MAVMFGFASVSDNTVKIANRIFETCLYNLFLSEPGVKELHIKDKIIEQADSRKQGR